MVRHKTRWLLVRIDFEKDICLPKASKNISDESQDDTFPSRKEIASAIRESILQCGGVAAGGAALDTQVRFCDSATRLAMIRVPREFYGLIRASLSFLTLLNEQRVVLTVTKVNGNARTAKLAAIRQVQASYRERLRKSNMSKKETDRTCRIMEETLSSIHNID